MRLPRPRSLTSLLILGVLVLVVPLVLALTQAVTQLRRLADQTDTLVRQGVELTSQTQALYRYLSAYERAANLYLLLGDPRLLEASRVAQQQIAETAVRLADLPLHDAAGLYQARALRAATTGAQIVLEYSKPDEPDRERLLSARLAVVTAAAGELSNQVNLLLETRLQQLADQAESTRRRLFLWLAAMVPVALALGIVFALGVLSPLRSMDQAITELGQGTFSKPIAIRGSSDLEALGRQLEWLRVRLLELAQEKNRFLRHMSHELKTPLANIREGTDLLLDGAVGEIGPGQREVADIMRQNALRLQQLIENLLSHGSWLAQTKNLELSSFELSSVLASTFLTQKLAIAARRIRVTRDVDDVTLMADRAKLRLVFDNLLSNAVKFTPEGGSIAVRARRSDGGVTIDFADSGPGIPPNERHRIFQPFYTGSTPQAGPLKGTGIGLSIVAEFVTAHGGRVELVQGEFPGAHFRIFIPTTALAAGRHEVRASA